MEIGRDVSPVPGNEFSHRTATTMMPNQSYAGRPLPADRLALRSKLPLKPEPVELTGRYVRLAPLDVARDVDRLFQISNGQPCRIGERTSDAYDAEALIWRYMFGGPFATAVEMAGWLQAQVDAPNGLALTVFDMTTGSPIGVANYINNVPEHLKIELGNIWYSPLAQRTAANTEASYLLARHAFGLGYRRLEWKCDSLNERSRRAALRLGFTFEGIHEFHLIVKGRNRDTAWFRMLDHEWPAVRERLEALLYGREASGPTSTASEVLP
jgi:RimJ/RimL family protein N-acetyltransferase